MLKPEGGKASTLLPGITASGRGEAPKGQVLAILGASGAGKTSLLRILAAQVPAAQYSGTVAHQAVPPPVLGLVGAAGSCLSSCVPPPGGRVRR